MSYPLLFPTGEDGWHPDLKKVNANRRDRVSQKDYYSYLIFTRDFFNPLHHAGKLFQQFMVDSFVKIEQNRLNWHRQNQKVRNKVCRNFPETAG